MGSVYTRVALALARGDDILPHEYEHVMGVPQYEPDGPFEPGPPCVKAGLDECHLYGVRRHDVCMCNKCLWERVKEEVK